jgi:hypothetical protein
MYDIVFIGSSGKQFDKLKEKYPTAKLASNYMEAKSMCFTKFFWVVWPDVNISDTFDFSYKVDEYSKEYIHVFKNCQNFDGVCLIPKNVEVSEKELNYRFFRNKKEVNITASNPAQYDKIYVSNYDDYVLQLTTVTSEFVWVVPTDIEVDFTFDYQIPYWDKDVIHIFKNGKFNDGLFLQHRDRYISRREYEYCWHTKKKEISTVVSKPKPYDIVFISYQEPNADKNFERLLKQFPDRVIHRVHGVEGIHQAHIEAAKVCDTVMFWVVDGDAEVLDTFNFELQVPKWQKDNVFVWRSRNPVNDLEYGYGGIKLFPVKETLEMDVTKTDMTTSISTKFNAMSEVSNITVFNTDAFSTWKSAFRECCKLSSKTIRGQVDNETDERLQIWTTVSRNVPFSEYAIAGAIAGKQYGLSNGVDLGLINNFDWLYEQFQKHTVE